MADKSAAEKMSKPRLDIALQVFCRCSNGRRISLSRPPNPNTHPNDRDFCLAVHPAFRSVAISDSGGRSGHSCYNHGRQAPLFRPFQPSHLMARGREAGNGDCYEKTIFSRSRHEFRLGHERRTSRRNRHKSRIGSRRSKRDERCDESLVARRSGVAWWPWMGLAGRLASGLATWLRVAARLWLGSLCGVRCGCGRDCRDRPLLLRSRPVLWSMRCRPLRTASALKVTHLSSPL